MPALDRSLVDAEQEQTESKRLFEQFKAKTKIVTDEFLNDNRYNKLTERLENEF